MFQTITLDIVDGIKVVVPDSLDLLTPFVLQEQRDWFEDEIRFLRGLLKPGQKAIDIGANYGLYTLSVASVVGRSGRVWAFEPASATADLLRQSVAANGFDHVTVEQCAMSEQEGSAQFTMHDHAECNALVRGALMTQPTEFVSLVTLDSYARAHDWSGIDFIKIDAEGEEVNILRGGQEFLTRNAPLIQYEIRAGRDLDLDLVRSFSDLGYESYRLVPGMNVLIPFRADSEVDRYLLNVFACKPEQAARMASEGRLIAEKSMPDAISRGSPGSASDDVDTEWPATLTALPYGRMLAAQWQRRVADADAGAMAQALASYLNSRNDSLPVAERFDALSRSYHRFRSLVDGSPTQARLSSLARIAQDFGARAVAIDALSRLFNSIAQHGRVDLDEPFLAPAARFDSLDPQGALGDWMLVAAAEQLERLQEYSTFYRGRSAQQRLEMICRSEFASPDMHRRLSLLRQRFGLTEATSAD